MKLLGEYKVWGDITYVVDTLLVQRWREEQSSQMTDETTQ